jgi:hypothetical protein
MGASALAAAVAYLELAARHAWHKRMEILDPRGGHRGAARAIRDQMRVIADLNSHNLRFTATVAEIQQEVRRALASGMRFISPDKFSDDLVLAVATALSLSGSEKGNIESANPDPPTVVFDDGSIHRFDQVGQEILFLEQ